MTWQDKCAKILSATITKKLKQQQNVYVDEGPMDKEYFELEQIGPAPGNPCMQHDAMVEQGLCKAAVANSTSNRYCNLFPYDSHRVKLETRDPTESDYINASWVNVEGVSDKFVLTMAPLIAYSPGRNTNSDNGASTCSSFWRMIDQTGTRTIVMMCTIERGFQGCSQYFPPEVETHQDHGEYRVTLQSIEHSADNSVVTRQFLLTKNTDPDGATSRTVQHLQFTKWPNYGVVENVEELGKFVKIVANNRKGDLSPMVVHCSGGVGRSGTFVSIYSLYRMLEECRVEGDSAPLERYNWLDGGREVTLVNVVGQLRQQRHPWMVEGEAQYMLAYAAVIYLLQKEINNTQDTDTDGVNH